MMSKLNSAKKDNMSQMQPPLSAFLNEQSLLLSEGPSPT